MWSNALEACPRGWKPARSLAAANLGQDLVLPPVAELAEDERDRARHHRALFRIGCPKAGDVIAQFVERGTVLPLLGTVALMEAHEFG